MRCTDRQRHPHWSALQQASSLHDSAASCHAAGKDRQAETLRLRTLELIGRLEGPGHPDAAVVLSALGRYPEAERSFQPALRIAESCAVSVSGSEAARRV
jgi:hypothetical protein